MATPKRSRSPTRAQAVNIDVDRIGVVALNAAAQKLELLPLGRPEAVVPTSLHFVCSYPAVKSSRQAAVKPTFPARDKSDRRLRLADRLRAGELVLRTFNRHIACNDRLHTIEVVGAPLMQADWYRLGVVLRQTPSRLSKLNLSGSRLFDTGLALLGAAILKHAPVELGLARCGLSAGSCSWLVKLLQSSNLRLNEGRRTKELRAWTSSLRGRDGADFRDSGFDIEAAAAPEGRLGKSRRRKGASAADDDPAPSGIERIDLSGNALGDSGARVLANYLARDSWLVSIDLTCNGISSDAANRLRTAAAAARMCDEPAEARAEGMGDERMLPQRLEPLEPLTIKLHEPAPKRAYSYPRPPARWNLDPDSEVAAGDEARARRAATKKKGPAERALRGDADRLRGLEERRRELEAAAGHAEQMHRFASAVSDSGAPALSPAELAGLVEACGGARPMLDALESLIASTLHSIGRPAAKEVS